MNKRNRGIQIIHLINGEKIEITDGKPNKEFMADGYLVTDVKGRELTIKKHAIAYIEEL